MAESNQKRAANRVLVQLCTANQIQLACTSHDSMQHGGGNCQVEVCMTCRRGNGQSDWLSHQQLAADPGLAQLQWLIIEHDRPIKPYFVQRNEVATRGHTVSRADYMVRLAQIKCTRSKSAGLVFAILGLKIESPTKSRTTPLLMIIGTQSCNTSASVPSY